MTSPLALLDLDGTLSDSAASIMVAARYAFTALDLPVPPESALREFVGPPLTTSFGHHGVPADQVDRAIAAYREHYVGDGVMFEAPLFAGVQDALVELADAGIDLAVATSKAEPLAIRVVDHLGLAGLLAGVFGSNLDGTRTDKADVVGHALSTLRPGRAAPYDDVVMVGDRKYDVLGARAHGLDTIGVSWGAAPDGELASAGAVAVVDTPADLVAAVRTRFGR